MSGLESASVLGSRVHVCTYRTALEAALRLIRENRPAALTACNTHLVAHARHDPSFAAVLGGFDLVLPDGYPLVWAINAGGRRLEDRVYGPYFMKYAIEHSPASTRHFFFGGTPETLGRLTEAARRFRPDVRIAGTLSPPFRKWSEQDEAVFAAAIRAARPDFVWVALGGERQERWIAANLHRHERGLFCAVGDAFLLLAGGRPFAPKWMQRRGLTWLYRLAQEPRRLWPRYLKYNTLFLYYLFTDRVRRIFRRPRAPRVAFLGSRGVPARYSGFEVVVENLGSRLAERGYDVVVYNRFPHANPGLKVHAGMRIRTLPTIPTRSLDTIVHTALSSIIAVFARYDLIYLCGVGNAILGGFLRLTGLRVVLNVDGADFRRPKWGTFARLWLRGSELLAPSCSDILIADNPEIVRRYERSYGVTPCLLSYGAVIRDSKVDVGELARWGLEPGKYILYVSRLTPENEALALIEAYAGWGGPLRLVICGSYNYELMYYRRLRRAAVPGVIFTGGRYGDAYIELSQNAAFFVMPAAIEATRLVLLDQMGMGVAILYRDATATREVLGDAAEPYDAAGGAAALAAKMTYLAGNPGLCAELGARARRRASELFSWEAVTNRYVEIFGKLGLPKP